MALPKYSINGALGLIGCDPRVKQIYQSTAHHLHGGKQNTGQVQGSTRKAAGVLGSLTKKSTYCIIIIAGKAGNTNIIVIAGA